MPFEAWNGVFVESIDDEILDSVLSVAAAGLAKDVQTTEAEDTAAKAESKIESTAT